MELLKQKRVHFVALDVGIDTGSPMGEFALNVFLAALLYMYRRRQIAYWI
jgi:DNA invertase Pin-like site-specific DNA recombinase